MLQPGQGRGQDDAGAEHVERQPPAVGDALGVHDVAVPAEVLDGQGVVSSILVLVGLVSPRFRPPQRLHVGPWLAASHGD